MSIFFLLLCGFPAIVLFFRAILGSEEKPGAKTLWLLFIIGLAGLMVLFFSRGRTNLEGF